MSLLSSFIASHIVDSLEKEFLSHEPELQEAFLNEVKDFAEVVGNWLKEKLAPNAE